MSKIFIGIIFFVSQFSFSEELSDFEKMLSGFPECKFDGVYLDLDKQIPQHKYFIDRKMSPNKIEGHLARFDIDESYYGLHVSEIHIPADTLSVVAIVVDQNRKSVEKSLKNILVNGYNKEFVEGSLDPNMMLVPTIEEYKPDKTKTVISCINPI